MVNLHLAYTAPINPSDLAPSEPILSTAQVWQGLRRKVRNAPEFVSAITSCTVLEDKESSEGVIVREVVFGANPDAKIKETCHLYEPMKVDFVQTDGSVISNVISDGPTVKSDDLYMTYAFSWLHPDVSAESEQARELLKKHKGMAKMAVDKSIEAIRRLVREGQIS